MTHVGYINAGVLCGACGQEMGNHEWNRPHLGAEGFIAWIVVCRNGKCPHRDIPYQVLPSVQMESIDSGTARGNIPSEVS